MLQYERIDISEGTDPIKSNKSKECMICHFWFDSVCHACHGLTM